MTATTLPSRSTGARAQRTIVIPRERNDVDLEIAGRTVRLTNLHKPFWTTPLITKGDLLQYYADVAPVLLPHLRDRAMVMKRYPDGAGGPFFFMKRAPAPRPDWIALCRIRHASGNVIDFPMVQDLPSLLWVVNLGCIDLNQWYARCDDVDRPDYVHFDLDPGEKASFEQVLETAVIVHETLDGLEMPSYAKTTGSRGMHVYVPIVRGPTQKQAWTFAKTLAIDVGVRARAAARRPHPRGLQPERLGTHPRLGILRAAPPAGLRLDSCHPARGAARYPPRGFPRRQRARASRKARRSVGAAGRARRPLRPQPLRPAGSVTFPGSCSSEVARY